MPYLLIIKQRAEKDIKKLPKADILNINSSIQLLKNNPRPQGCLKLKGYADTYRIRVADYRILYIIEDRKLTIEIVRVINRKEGYRLV